MHLTAQPVPEASRSASPRRRVLISGGLASGGMQTHVALLCALLREAGAEVTIASASSEWKPEDSAKVRALGVNILASPFGFGQWKLLGKAWALAQWTLFLRSDFNVLYCIGEGRMHLRARKFVSEDAFQVFHEIVECVPDVWKSGTLAEKMNGIIGNSDRVSQQLAERFPAVPVRTLPFCTSSRPTPPPAPRPAVGTRELRVAFLGRLVPHKRPVKLIEAFAALHCRAPLVPARLDFYGGDQAGLGTEMRAQVEKAGLENSVAIHGGYASDDLERILAAIDVVVLPSLYEGLPLVLVEAMLRGVPVVATSAGGTAELGRDNPDVIITPGTDWAAFEKGLMEMADRLRTGQIDSQRLHAWTEARYGYQPVADAWRNALLSPETYFAAKHPAEVGA